MTMKTYKLPTDAKELGKLVRNHAHREQTRMSFRRLTWLVAWYYINGA